MLSVGSEKTLSDFEREFAELRPYHLHENYDGTSDPGKTGWNYLNFEVPLIPGIFLWLTQLDEPRQVPKRTVEHTNGAREPPGLLDLEAQKLTRLGRVAGGEVVRGPIALADSPSGHGGR